MKNAILLINLGTPDSLSLFDLKKYLKEFLMDKKVIGLPYWIRYILVNFLIIPLRIKISHKAYAKIWFEKGSPLLIISQKIANALEKVIGQRVFLAMRYGNPSIEKIVQEINQESITHLTLVPMYPHYAMSSFETAVDKFEAEYILNNCSFEYKTIKPFFADELYIKSLVSTIKPYIEKDYDQILFSYHGIPMSHVTRLDETRNHCLKNKSCCENPQHMRNLCYRHQVFATTEAVVNSLGIPKEKYSLSYQSRIANERWLSPYTDHKIIDLAKSGCQKLLVICPSFLTECLETLEEIDIRAREVFLSTARVGATFEMIPCLNDDKRWIKSLAQIIKNANN